MQRLVIVFSCLFLLICDVSYADLFNRIKLQNSDFFATPEQLASGDVILNELELDRNNTFNQWEITIQSLQDKAKIVILLVENNDLDNAISEMNNINLIINRLNEYANSNSENSNNYAVEAFNYLFTPKSVEESIEFLSALKPLNETDFMKLSLKAFQSKDENTRNQGITFFKNYLMDIVKNSIAMIQAVTDNNAQKALKDRYFQAKHDGKTMEEVITARAQQVQVESGYFSGFFYRLWDNIKLIIGFSIFLGVVGAFFNRKVNALGGFLRVTFASLVPSILLIVLLTFIPIIPHTAIAFIIILVTFILKRPASILWRFLPQQVVALCFENTEHEIELGSGTHGSASWGTTKDMQSKNHISDNSQNDIAIGRDPATKEIFRFMGHLIVCAPTGSGKGIGSVVPNLLNYKGSSIVVDLKGENYAITHRQRKELGQKIICIDPFDVSGSGGNPYNPLNRIDITNPDCVGISLEIAKSMVVSDKNTTDNHWNESAENLLQGLILFVKLLEPEKQTLAEVRRLLTLPMNNKGGELLPPDHPDVSFLDIESIMQSLKNEAFGIIARAGNNISSKPEKEKGSILSTAQRHTAFLDDPRIANALGVSDNYLEEIKKEKCTVYIILPPNKLEQNARFVRLIVDGALSAVTSSSFLPDYRVAFFLDEFAQLGYMNKIESGVSLLRGYGAIFIIYLQDLSQLKGVYNKWQSFLANACKVFYGTSDFDTAKYISDSLGKRTLEYQTVGESKSSGMHSSESESQQFTGRSLLEPDEVMRMGAERPIVLISGEKPYQLIRLNYLVDQEYQNKFDDNPYHK